MEKEKIEVQDIIKNYGKEYKENHKIMPHVAKAMGAIEKCRTEELGYHEDVCDECEVFSCSNDNTIRIIFSSKTK